MNSMEDKDLIIWLKSMDAVKWNLARAHALYTLCYPVHKYTLYGSEEVEGVARSTSTNVKTTTKKIETRIKTNGVCTNTYDSDFE